MRKGLTLFGTVFGGLYLADWFGLKAPEVHVFGLGLGALVWYVFYYDQPVSFDRERAQERSGGALFVGIIGTVLLFWIGLDGIVVVAIVGTIVYRWWTTERGPMVSRPDVLGTKTNIASVIETLPKTPFGVFCGEIEMARKRTDFLVFPRPKEIEIARRSLYVSAEDRGIVIGPPGTGKTAFMVTQLMDWAARGCWFVCLDIKPKLHQILAP